MKAIHELHFDINHQKRFRCCVCLKVTESYSFTASNRTTRPEVLTTFAAPFEAFLI